MNQMRILKVFSKIENSMKRKKWIENLPNQLSINSIIDNNT